MSALNEYTEEDVLSLNSMVDTFNNNINHYEPINAIDPIGIWRLYRPCEILGTPVVYILNKFINFLSPTLLDYNMEYLIYHESIENVPLYINKPDNLGLIAQWRLQIGK